MVIVVLHASGDVGLPPQPDDITARTTHASIRIDNRTPATFDIHLTTDCDGRQIVAGLPVFA